MVLGDGLDQRSRIADCRKHMVATVGQDLDDARPDYGRVIGDNHSQRWLRAHGLAGSSTVSTVGPPNGLSIVS